MALEQTRRRTAPDARSRHGDRTLVLGTGELARRLVARLQQMPRHHHVVGCVAEGVEAPRTVGGVPVVGSVADLPRLIEQVYPTRVIMAFSERRERLPMERLVDIGLRGITIEDGVELYEHCSGMVALEHVNPGEWLLGRRLRRARAHAVVARVTSCAIGLVGLVLLAPLLALIAVAIKLDSRGPVFFVQRRVGLNGIPFALIKFRSMHPPPHGRRSEWAGDNSDRVTRVGRLLRKFWLDELPELANMVRGDMNLVGPRPHPESNWVLFTMVLRNMPVSGQRIPYYSLRTLVRPGLTGWAQVRYRYANNLEEEVEKAKYDLYYVKYRTTWMDVRIVLATIRLMLSGRGTAPIDVPRPGADEPVEPLESAQAHG